jgi:hypothetical protein
MTDYKQLCAELLRAMDEIEECEAVDWSLVKTKPLKMANQSMAEARAALADPEQPEGPTRGEAVAVYSEVMATHECQTLGDMAEHFARAVLARWGNHPGSPDSSTPQPVPVSERLPGDELCWWYEPDEDDGYGGMWTLLRIRGNTTRYSHWLPANALTQPS